MLTHPRGGGGWPCRATWAGAGVRLEAAPGRCPQGLRVVSEGSSGQGQVGGLRTGQCGEVQLLWGTGAAPGCLVPALGGLGQGWAE